MPATQVLVHGAAAAILNYQRGVERMRKLQDSGTVLFMPGVTDYCTEQTQDCRN